MTKRFAQATLAEIVRRAKAGESARSLAKAFEVAPSALTKLLRDHDVTPTKRIVTDHETAALTQAYEAGATMRQLEAKHGLSHGAVFRALHRSGVEMRAKAPQRKLPPVE
ncbi:helix-turn-helix domain-containing protein [Agrococcus sp. ARC_14]|uniref:helix-turn-helix domain-containing protein n=1 Tax=Agrococcus sp. ARC_14 TaxID=2919927 RepID=UPI001F06D8BD|nr:helix-turn-helix domain-containing protein [Agrococcus sp. ARC_14]MCH1882456.1 helix-turn-helix domain-containing protein [Agrococcus sp. ARC_14]